MINLCPGEDFAGVGIGLTVEVGLESWMVQRVYHLFSDNSNDVEAQYSEQL